MSDRPPRRLPIRRALRGLSVFSLTLLAIEFVDEFAFGTREAAWPLIRNDLHLSYTEIGILPGLPTFLRNCIEPAHSILAGPSPC